MICAHCKNRDVTVDHVRGCAVTEQRVRSVGAKEVVTVDPPKVFPSLATLTQTDAAAEVEGVYCGDTGVYFKVVSGTNTGNYYAKSWDTTEDAWVYAGRRPLHELTLAHKVTAEQAEAFGHITGSCVFCTRKLTDERSIVAGYGPKCAENNGLPWG